MVPAAFVSHSFSVSCNEYRVVLPLLPTAIAAFNTGFLQYYVSGRPYHPEDFRQSFEQLEALNKNRSTGAIPDELCLHGQDEAPSSQAPPPGSKAICYQALHTLGWT